MTALEHRIRQAAWNHGFTLVGFARLRRLVEREAFFEDWLAQGRAGEMGWLARDPQRRFDPRALDMRLCSVVSLGFPYRAPAIPEVDWRTEMRGRIAAYALGPDYHDTVLANARKVADEISAAEPDAVLRTYVDTGPVFEREWAAEARLGWFGRNTNLLNKRQGSYFFLAEIFTDVQFDAPSAPYREHCGTCRQCLDLCPTKALDDGYLLEPRRCISYLTIEHRGAIPHDLRAALGNWIFGCDICQEVCPWNSEHFETAANDELAPRLRDLMALDETGFRQRFGRTAIKRTKRRGLLRNAAVALGNTGNPAAAPVLAQILASEAEPLIREHAAWALGRIGGRSARLSLRNARGSEPDPSVRAEIEFALDQL